MPNFNKAVITQKGLALITKANAGQTMIQFTKAATGSGSHLEEQDLSLATELVHQEQVFHFTRKEIRDGRTVVLRSIVSNENLDAGYQITEFGIFAADPDEGEILYSIATAVNGQADTLPAYSEGGLVSMTVDSYVTVAASDQVEIVTGAGAYATQEDLESLEQTIDMRLAAKADKSTKVEATIAAADWTGAEIPYRATVSVAGVTETNVVEVLLDHAAGTDAEQAALVEACGNAGITGGTQAPGSVTLEAYGDKPEVDLPLIFIVRGDI